MRWKKIRVFIQGPGFNWSRRDEQIILMWLQSTSWLNRYQPLCQLRSDKIMCSLGWVWLQLHVIVYDVEVMMMYDNQEAQNSWDSYSDTDTWTSLSNISLITQETYISYFKYVWNSAQWSRARRSLQDLRANLIRLESTWSSTVGHLVLPGLVLSTDFTQEHYRWDKRYQWKNCRCQPRRKHWRCT